MAYRLRAPPRPQLDDDGAHWQCHHRAIMSATPWPDDVPVPTFGPRMVCTRCGIIGEAPGRTGGSGRGRNRGAGCGSLS
jgi:hypothetical protein